MSDSLADILIHPAFRDECRNLDAHDLAELDLAIYRLRRAEIAGCPSGDIFELPLARRVIFYDDVRMKGKRLLVFRSMRPVR